MYGFHIDSQLHCEYAGQITQESYDESTVLDVFNGEFTPGVPFSFDPTLYPLVLPMFYHDGEGVGDTEHFNRPLDHQNRSSSSCIMPPEGLYSTTVASGPVRFDIRGVTASDNRPGNGGTCAILRYKIDPDRIASDSAEDVGMSVAIVFIDAASTFFGHGGHGGDGANYDFQGCLGGGGGGAGTPGGKAGTAEPDGFLAGFLGEPEDGTAGTATVPGTGGLGWDDSTVDNEVNPTRIPQSAGTGGHGITLGIRPPGHSFDPVFDDRNENWFRGPPHLILLNRGAIHPGGAGGQYGRLEVIPPDVVHEDGFDGALRGEPALPEGQEVQRRGNAFHNFDMEDHTAAFLIEGDTLGRYIIAADESDPSTHPGEDGF